MMPRLTLERHARPGIPSWPEFENRHAAPLYLSRRRYRKLVVLLDDDVLDDEAVTAWGKDYLLAGLLTLDVIECSRYADAGPPDNIPRRKHQFIGDSVPGWAVLSLDDGSGYHSVRTTTGDQVSNFGIFGNAPDIAANDTRTGAYNTLDPAEAATRRRADALAAMVANSIHADLFISNRPYLHAVTWNLADGVTIVGVDGALAAIGMYLRAQDEYVTSRNPRGGGTHKMNRGLYFWVGTRELLPSAWRWSAAFAQHATGGGDDKLSLLGQSVLQRTERALQVRDDVHIGLNKPQDNDTADDALSSLDVVLLLLMGAVDATVRVVHAVLELSSPARIAGLHKDKWIADVSRVAPTLGALFAPGTNHAHALTILRLLRNSIHGEALQPLGVVENRKRDRTLVNLPASEEPRLREAFMALGGLANWGVEELIPGHLHFDPGVLLEELFPRVLAMLNDIMVQTPVERLAHVTLPSTDLNPTVWRDSETFDEQFRQSIRWQLGL